MKTLNIDTLNRKNISIIGLVIFIIILFSSSYVSASEDVDDPILTEARMYMEINSDGEKYFNLEKAIKDEASEEAIKIGIIANDIIKGYKSEEENKITPFVSFGRIGEYGHYCGKGNDGWDKYPIDELDAACENHDRCYSWDGDNTSCNARFCRELDSIIENSIGFVKVNYARAAKLIFC